MQALGIPLLPRVAHWIAMTTAQVSIGDPVIVHPGVYIVHGQVVVDGIIEIHSGAVLFPWVTLGLIGPELIGPTIGPRAQIGSGARVLGKVRVGSGRARRSERGRAGGRPGRCDRGRRARADRRDLTSSLSRVSRGGPGPGAVPSWRSLRQCS